MKRLVVFAAVVAYLVTSAACLQAAESIVWQIGKPDNNYAEFAIAHNYQAYAQNFRKPKPFDPAKDDPAKSWPFIQPGPSDTWAGGKEHPLTIAFDLPKQPTGIYTLTIDFVDTHAGAPPVYDVSINGKSGRFNLPAGAGDASITDASKGKEFVVKIPFPGAYLKPGRNEIVLDTVEGSWLLYDYISLTNSGDQELPEPTVKRLTVIPTIRFIQDGQKLKQVIEMSAEFTSGSPTCTATVTVAGNSETFTIEPGLLGTAHQELYVDEIKTPTQAEVSITLNGKTQSATCELTPQRHWKLYVQDSTHVDIGYTDFQERIAQRHNDNMTAALELCKQYPDFKWNTEAAWVEDNYLSMMPADKKADFIKYAQAGRIGCEAIYGNMLTGICSHESFIRDLYFSHNMARKYGIPWDIAMSSDVPTQIWTLPTALSSAGIKYFTAGLNLTRGNSFDKMFSKPFYWQGPDGGKVLTWLAPGYGYAAGLRLVGGVTGAVPHVQNYLMGFERDDYPYDAAFAFGGFGDNQPINIGLAPTVSDWNKKYAYPKIILCRGPEFFEYVESGFKDKIPTFSGDAGTYWEDGAGSSAMETAKNREAKENLAAAEKMSTLASILYGTPYPKADFDAAWKNAILYDEHTWGAAGAIDHPTDEQTVHQWKIKSQFAIDADAQAKKALQKGIDALTARVKVPTLSMFVYNPTSSPISGWAWANDPRGSYALVWANGVPALGYRLVPTPKEITALRVQNSNPPAIESAYYRIELDAATGGIKSLYDKQLKRELVDQESTHKLNQFVYTLGRRQGEDVREIKEVTRDSITSPVVFYTSTSRAGSAITVTADVNGGQLTSHIGLYNNEKRVDFTNTLNKKETTEKEAGYFAFPFALTKPTWHIELPDGVVCPSKNMLPGADMEWYCTQNFVAASDPNATVVWTAVDAPLITIGDINRDTFRSPIPIDSGRLFSYAFNNYWFTNYKASQSGEMTFRYSLTSMPKYDGAAAARFGEAVRNPLIAKVLEPNRKGSGAAMASICSVSAPNVTIQAVKQAETGKGVIIRLRELSGKKTTVSLTLNAGKFKQAYLCSLVEDPKTKLKLSNRKVTVPVPANGLATVLLIQ